MVKKVSVIGRGTVGCIAVSNYLAYTDWDIDWIFDPKIDAVSVGEGTNLKMPMNLSETIGLSSEEFDELKATPKIGILKKNWGSKGKDNVFLHGFPAGLSAMHFNANVFQQVIFKKLMENKRINIIEKNIIDEDQVDSDRVMICTGTPKTFDEYYISNNIPVDSCLVFQCPWDYPKFNYSVTFAMKYGWVFGIPLQNRCSIGYLFNKQINSTDEIDQDVKHIINEFDLKPEFKRSIYFNNYYKKINNNKRIFYNGNASYFLEPLEATSTGFAINIILNSINMWNEQCSVQFCVNDYLERIKNIESMIILHYASGSTFDTPFWKKAKLNSLRELEKRLSNLDNFTRAIIYSLQIPNDKLDRRIFLSKKQLNNFEVGSWHLNSFKTNISNLNLSETLKDILLKNGYEV